TNHSRLRRSSASAGFAPDHNMRRTTSPMLSLPPRLEVVPPMLPRGMSPSGVRCLFHGRGPQDNGRVPWYLPVVLGIKRRGATAAIARVLAGPQGLPLHLFRRGKQRLWSRDQGQVAPEVHDQQPVVAVHTEEAEYK